MIKVRSKLSGDTTYVSEQAFPLFAEYYERVDAAPAPTAGTQASAPAAGENPPAAPTTPAAPPAPAPARRAPGKNDKE
ncbi:hypothetical protein JOL79_11295 [Microbispora sp. RL4-1S]|uniref:Uncharacterized protein n=1 Tax=Microbispora oryzae TaxID=2806554 RepID=A0A941AJP0_9ACTN|nr:hypothetical protein [Microbispora oryzae]MBP2704398.1 hypothetical protein [Microbispora oryzae]